MVNVTKIVQRAGKAIGAGTSLFKKAARRAAKIGGNAVKKTLTIAGDSLKKIKNKAKKLTKAQAAIIVSIGAVGTYAGVNIGDAMTEFNKRNNKEFTVKEVFYKEGDDVDEMSFVITNPEKIEIYPDDSFVIIYASPFYDSKKSNRTITLDDQPYLITETKISKDKENDDQPDLNPDVPYVITIKINGLDLSGKDKDMIKSATGDEKLFVIKLKADMNNDIKDEFEDDGEAVKEALEKALGAVADTGDDFLKWILEQLLKLAKPLAPIGYILLALFLIWVLYQLYNIFIKK